MIARYGVLVLLTWLGGGAVTDTGPPKSPKVRTLVEVTTGPPCPGISCLVTVVTRPRPRPCWSTYTVPLTVPPGKLRRCAVNAYLVPVQPGPEAGPTLRTVAA